MKYPTSKKLINRLTLTHTSDSNNKKKNTNEKNIFQFSLVSRSYLIILTSFLMLTSYNLAIIFRLNSSFVMITILAIEMVFYYFYLQNNKNKPLDSLLEQFLEQFAYFYKSFPDYEYTFRQLTQVQSLNALSVSIYIALRYRHLYESVFAALANNLPSESKLIKKTVLMMSDFERLGINLGDFAARYAKYLQKEQFVKKEIHQIMFQNKVSAYATCLIIPFMTLIAVSVSETYRTILLATTGGRIVGIFCFAWWAIGVFISLRLTYDV